MNKIRLSVVMVLLMTLLSACNISETNMNDLKAPESEISPLEGKWTVIDYTPISRSNSKEEDEYMGQPALFHRDALIFMNYYTVRPSFKMKKVNAVDYLLYKYKMNATSLGIKTNKIEVFTIYDDNNLLMEAIEDGEGNLLLYIEEGFYRLEKTIDTVSVDEIYKYIDIEKDIAEDFKDEEKEHTNSGVLLGIKTSEYDEKNNVADWEYTTVWINTEDGEFKESYKINELLLPRKNGFWEINVDRTIKDKNVYDTIEANQEIYIEEDSTDQSKISTKDISTRNKDLKAKDKTSLKNILYVGNNYISTENIDLKDKNKRTINIQTVDNLKRDNSIKLSDIMDEGKEIFLEGTQGLLNIDEAVSINEENIGITRKNGYWMLKGRVNFEQKEKEVYKDFIIKTVPSEDMVGYDNHFILWDELKRKFPNMIDMYSSPNEDIIVVRDKFQLLVYSINKDNTIDYDPIARIDIPEGDSIVMAEWATEKYTEIWRNEILKRDTEKIE